MFYIWKCSESIIQCKIILVKPWKGLSSKLKLIFKIKFQLFGLVFAVWMCCDTRKDEEYE